MQLQEVSLGSIEETIVPTSGPRQKSLELIGQRRPVVLRPGLNGTYAIIEGHRRIADLRAMGKETVTAMIAEDMDDVQARLDSLSSNASRSPNPIHEAYDIGFLMSEGWLEEEIASHIGRTQGFVSQRAGLLNLIPELKRLTERGKVRIGAARKVCRLSPEEQREWLESGTFTEETAGKALRAGKSKRSALADIQIPDVPVPLPGHFVTGADMAKAAAEGEIEIEWGGERFRIVRM